jgi:hypothetical protein
MRSALVLGICAAGMDLVTSIAVCEEDGGDFALFGDLGKPEPVLEGVFGLSIIFWIPLEVSILA